MANWLPRATYSHQDLLRNLVDVGVDGMVFGRSMLEENVSDCHDPNHLPGNACNTTWPSCHILSHNLGNVAADPCPANSGVIIPAMAVIASRQMLSTGGSGTGDRDR